MSTLDGLYNAVPDAVKVSYITWKLSLTAFPIIIILYPHGLSSHTILFDLFFGLIYGIGQSVPPFGLRAVPKIRPRMIEWYDNQILIVVGNEPVKMLLSQMARAFVFEMIIFFICMVYGTIEAADNGFYMEDTKDEIPKNINVENKPDDEIVNKDNTRMPDEKSAKNNEIENEIRKPNFSKSGDMLLKSMKAPTASSGEAINQK